MGFYTIQIRISTIENGNLHDQNTNLHISGDPTSPEIFELVEIGRGSWRFVKLIVEMSTPWGGC
jgi:hypothetical protein